MSVVLLSNEECRHAEWEDDGQFKIEIENTDGDFFDRIGTYWWTDYLDRQADRQTIHA